MEHVKKEAEQEKRWRNECTEVCSVLTIRLNELAGFLDSLLKHKDVLSVLAQDSHKEMRKAVDNSLDLSRSLSLSSAGRFSLNEKSLMQMSSITSVLNDSYFIDRDTSTHHDLVNASIVEKLRSEIHGLRSELDRVKQTKSTENGSLIVAGVDTSGIHRDRSFRNVSQNLEINSDSEEQWSEPDRQVSHERIGLETSTINSHIRSPCANKYKASSTASDENEVRLTRKNSSLRMQEKIIDLEAQLTNKATELAALHDTILSNNKDVAATKEEIATLTDKLNECQHLKCTFEASLKETRMQLMKAEQDFANKIECSEQMLKEQKTVNNDLAIELDKLKSEMHANDEAHVKQLNELIARETDKLNSIRQELNAKYEEDLKYQKNLHNEMVNRDMISRVHFEEQMQRCDELEKRLIDTENLLQIIRANENDLKVQIDDKEKLMRDLKRNVDDATLNHSRAVLERTKFMNERDQLEKLSHELQKRYDLMASERSELHTRLAKLSHENAQLHNKLVVNETQFQLTRSASQGNARYALTSPKSTSLPAQYNGSVSSGDQSGEQSSDEIRQRLENSSPDLGIDSDGTGRSSGTDGNAVRSPTLKLSRSKKCDLNDSYTNILLEGDEEMGKS